MTEQEISLFRTLDELEKTDRVIIKLLIERQNIMRYISQYEFLNEDEIKEAKEVNE